MGKKETLPNKKERETSNKKEKEGKENRSLN